MRYIAFIILLLFANTIAMAQPVERPPRPGEQDGRVPQTEKRPAVERRIIKMEKIRPVFGVSGGVLIGDLGSWGAIDMGVMYSGFGFGLELGYLDYQREFLGTAVSFMSPGNREVIEKGSFFRPSVYGEYNFDFGPLVIIPKFTLGYGNIICRRWEVSSTDDTVRFERKRLVNTWALDIGLSMGGLYLSGSVQWWIVNPWFFVYPEDYGIFTVGGSLGYRLP